MTILHTADWHVGVETHGTIDPKTGLSTRLLDFLRSIDSIVDHAIKEKVDAFLFAGDAFKVRDPNPTHQREFSTRIRKLAKAGIPVFLCIGNHDTPMAHGRATSVDIYQALEMDNVWVSRRPEIVTIPTKRGPLQILSIPWLKSEDIPTIGETLHDLYEKLDNNIPTVTVAHADVAGAVYSSEQQVSITSQNHVFPLSLLIHEKVDYIALGHIHRHQVLSHAPPVVYAGSIERIDFGEEEEEKGFVVVGINRAPAKKKRRVSWMFHPTPSRPFLTLRHTIDATDQHPTKTISTMIEKASIGGKIMRIILTIPHDATAPIDFAAIRKICEGATLTGISRILEQQTRSRLSSTESPTSLSTMDALNAYLMAKNIKGVRARELVAAAEKLIL
ncbi:MAG: exonuclease SbcCD subunit D [bacterium]|nr:exonuclease SbcCD subunit D [bacterium]